MTIELAPHERTLPSLLRRQAEVHGDRPAVWLAGGGWSHAEAPRVAARRGACLRAAGIGRGDRVAVMCSNRLEFLETVLGCGWIGAAVVPINTASRAPQIEQLLRHSGARLLVIEDTHLARLAGIDRSGLPLASVWVVGEGVPADEPLAVAWPHADRSVDGSTALMDAADVEPGDTLAILYTSGTTGPAKGVMCPHAQYYGWGLHSTRILGLRGDDVLCTTLPLFHVNALNTYAQAAVSGARAVFETRFSASGFWPAMRAHGASVVYLLGAMVPILLSRPPEAAERDHRIRVGLGPGVPAAAAQAFLERTGVDLLEGYGSTETNFVIATAPGATRRGPMGRLQPGFDARVVDEHDVERPDGEAGELVLRADEPFFFATGYFGMPEATVQAWRNLWFHTGDRVVREADGAFRFIDRIKDAIRRRGENISSYEVEQALLAHPAVAEAAVYPVRSELAEDEVMASIVAREGMSIDPADVWRHCDAVLPAFSVPRYLDVAAALPRTENGKVQKYRLRERGVVPTAHERAPRR